MKFSSETRAICTAIVALVVSALCASAQVLTFEQAKQRADQGDAFAQAVVALHYQLGWNTQKNPELAAKYAIASAEAGHPLGQFRLGALLRAGEGVPKDEQQGLALQSASFNALYDAQDPYSITSAAIMIFQGKVVGQNISEDERRRDAAGLYRKAADMGYAPAQFNYAMALNDGHGVKKNPALFERYLTQARAASYPLAQTFAQKSSQGARSTLEGFSGEERWAYEFIEHQVEPTAKLSTDSSGLIVFADSDIVVRAAEFRGTVAAGSIKTELSFYDTRSGRLQAVFALPNRVFQVGRVEAGKADLFYIGTVTAAKYCYDDYPLALTLVDLKSRKLERIPLVQEDYWLALNNDVKIASSGNQLLVKVQPGLSDQYISNRPASPSFRMLQVAIEEASNPEEQPYHHDISEARHAALVKKDSPALSYLGSAPVSATDPAKTRGVFAVGSGGSNSSFPKILKLDPSGQLILFDLSSLQV